VTVDPGRDSAALAFIDEDGVEVRLDAVEATTLLGLTEDLDGATVSGCPDCRSRVLACLALVDLIDAAAPHPRGAELVDLADDAPSSHCYLQDLATPCRHPRWLDPGRAEWEDLLARLTGPPRGPRH
jgi:hypothetical protein